MHMISIIVPVYNAEMTLKRCVDSILNQKYREFELILIDDGSKDRSGEICDEYALKDTRIRVFHKTNGGASSARNVGLDNAKGKWITFCDSDDYVYPNWLENFYTHVSEVYDIVCQGMDSNKPLAKTLTLRTHGVNYDGSNVDVFIDLLHVNQILGYLFLKMFRRSIIRNNNIRFDESVTLQEDDIFVIEYLSHCVGLFSSDTKGYYYFVPDWSRKYNLEFKNCIENHTKIIKVLDGIPTMKNTHLYKYHSAMLAQLYLNDFCSNDDLSSLKKLRALHLKNFNASGMNSFSKRIMMADTKMIISPFFIKFVNKIGKKIRQYKNKK